MTREISRQAFLRGAVGAMAASMLLGSCRTASQVAPTSSSSAGPPDWVALDDSLEGRVVLPSSTEFASAKTIFNARFADSTPAAVVAVRSIDDVKKAVVFAANHGVKITARSGGHSYVGASTADSAMVVDLRQLPGGIIYDHESGLATIPVAAELDSVQTTLAPYGRSIPAGSCPSVGVGGLTLGGGLGSETRRCGLTCDTLVSASVVLPGGEAVIASADEHDDLFWALRGGGGGNCGVVTSLTFHTISAGDRDVVTVMFPEQATADVIVGWNTWLRAADRAIWGMVNVTAGPDLRCRVVLATPPGEGPRRASELGSAIGVQPVSSTSQTLGHLDFVHYFEGSGDAAQPRAFVAGSDVIGEMTSAAAESVVAAIAAWPRDLGAATAVIESLDAAVSDIDPAATAFPWRRHAACIQWYTETPESVDSATTWLTQAHEAVRANSVGGYVNYVEPNIHAIGYFAGNLLRLNVVRQTYDPNALMHSGLRY